MFSAVLLSDKALICRKEDTVLDSHKCQRNTHVWLSVAARPKIETDFVLDRLVVQ